jgi:hypothetical protein
MKNFKTLIFTTSYSNDIQGLNNRPIKWLNYHKNIGLDYSKILIVDDGSPELPNINELKIIDPSSGVEVESNFSFVPLTPHLGRGAGTNHDYPGWYRSFSYAGQYAKKFGYNKIIHIESDAYLTSKRIVTHFNELNSGWHSFWCARHNFPETAIQVICEDNLEKFFRVTSFPYSLFRGYAIETLLPFSNIERSFIGDRYGEYLNNPPGNCDYVCQAKETWDLTSKNN